jgi:RES domain-containing protein
VCSSCFDDEDLRAFVRQATGRRGCDFCEQFDSPTRALEEVCNHMRSCLEQYWSFAVDHLPYESAEGGYQGATWDTDDLLDHVGLSLPRDRCGRLFRAIRDELPDETWCEYDWLTLDTDQALASSWRRFCEVVKHQRRFFFHRRGTDDRDSFTPALLLRHIARMAQGLDLVRDIPEGIRLWRARSDLPKRKKAPPSEFGPPPLDRALQSNRMNPPGIPMIYLASARTTALRETQATQGHVGQWIALRSLRVLDLRKLPMVPGIFSGVDRDRRLGLRFLHHFAEDIMQPVPRDQRVHVEYVPSQVTTEFFRDFEFKGGRLHGIAYPSSVDRRGWNVALFASRSELGLTDASSRSPLRRPWLKFQRSSWVGLRPRS